MLPFAGGYFDRHLRAEGAGRSGNAESAEHACRSFRRDTSGRSGFRSFVDATSRLRRLDERTGRRDQRGAREAILSGADPIGRIIDWNRKDLANRRRRCVHARRQPVGRRLADALRVDSAGAAAFALFHSAVRPPGRSGASPRREPRCVASIRTIAMTEPSTMAQQIDASLGAQRFRASLMATLGALALSSRWSVSMAWWRIRSRVERARSASAWRSAKRRRRCSGRVVGDALRVASVGIVLGLALALLPASGFPDSSSTSARTTRACSWRRPRRSWRRSSPRRRMGRRGARVEWIRWTRCGENRKWVVGLLDHPFAFVCLRRRRSERRACSRVARIEDARILLPFLAVFPDDAERAQVPLEERPRAVPRVDLLR